VLRHSDYYTMPLELTSGFSVIDPRFHKVALPYVHAEKLYTGCR
jgi:gluconolactonase